MEITHRLVEDCIILDLDASRFVHPETVYLKNYVMHLLKGGSQSIIVNLSDVEMLDSFGIAVIVSLLKTCKLEGAVLSLYGLNPQVLRLFELTKMDRILDIWETEAQALFQTQQSMKVLKR